MKTSESIKRESKLPDWFAPILWSYDVAVLDPEASRQTVIVQAINYGNLNHWRWISHHYSKQGVRDTITALPMTTFRPPALKLAAAIFDIRNFNYAFRGADRSR